MNDINDKEIEKVISDYTDDLKEESSMSGAMVCDYNTFKTIYQLNARAATREEKKVIIAMIKVTGFEGNIDKSRKSIAANKVGATLASSLRRDDVVTGFDTSQYLIMLSNLTMENAKRVLDRLIKRINSEISKDVEIETEIQALEPVSTCTVFN